MKSQKISLPVWESININPIMSSLKIKKKWNQTKTWYLLTLFILVWFTHKKRRGKIQTGEKPVHQGLSKVFVFYTYSSKLWRTLVAGINYCKKALSECATLIWHFGVCFYLADAAVFFLQHSRSVPSVTQFCSLSNKQFSWPNG